MTNLAILSLAITLAAEPAPPAAPPAAETPAPAAAAASPAAPSPETPAPKTPAPPTPAPATPPVPELAKPPESDIEVLDEVVDLQASDAEDPRAAWYGGGYPTPVRILALPTARTLGPGGSELVIDHRATGAIYDSSRDRPWSEMANSFAGLDSSVRVGLGVRFGVIEGLDAGIYRAGTPGTDTYELDARFQAMRQEDMGVDLAIRAGLTWFAQPRRKDAAGVFGQLLATRLLARRILLSAGAFYHSSSTNDTKYNQDKAWSVAVGGGVEARVSGPLAVDAELVACTAGYCSRNPTFSAGLKLLTPRHTFAVVCGNTTYLTADGYIADTERPWSKLTLGLQITRSH